MEQNCINSYSGTSFKILYKFSPITTLFFGQNELILKHLLTVGPKISDMFEVVLSATFTAPYVALIL
jgi:hypothetical protein